MPNPALPPTRAEIEAALIRLRDYSTGLFATKPELVDSDIALLRRAVESLHARPCPHVVSSPEGTSYCTLAESTAAKIESLQADGRRLDWLQFHLCPDPSPEWPKLQITDWHFQEGATLREAVDAELRHEATPPAASPSGETPEGAPEGMAVEGLPPTQAVLANNIERAENIIYDIDAIPESASDGRLRGIKIVASEIVMSLGALKAEPLQMKPRLTEKVLAGLNAIVSAVEAGDMFAGDADACRAAIRWVNAMVLHRAALSRSTPASTTEKP